MSDGTGTPRQRSAPAWRPRLRRAGVLAAALAGSPCWRRRAAAAAQPQGRAPTTAYQKELAYAQCMRAHGEPGFPDPQSDGTFNINQGRPRRPRRSPDPVGEQGLRAPGGPRMTPAQQQRLTSQALKFAACMRAHGITSFQYSPPTAGHGWAGSTGANPRRSSGPRSRPAGSSCRSGGGS